MINRQLFMTHEIKNLIEHIWTAQQQNLKSVLATVVALEGSSYRRPGVRMFIQENGKTFGAVSGGCVEKEVVLQAQSVLESDVPKIMTYDGRYRLGCEGIIFILIEPVKLSEELKIQFETVLKKRIDFHSETFFTREEQSNIAFGTQFLFSGNSFSLRDNFGVPSEKMSCFRQTFEPLFQLYLFGAEHDTVCLCKTASDLGWQVTVVASADEAKTISFFEGAHQFISTTIDSLDVSAVDSQTAILLMTHSFNKDVQYLLALANTRSAYFGILGPKHRRERVIEKALDFNSELSIDFLERLHGPAGINIGAESAQEIAISILAEILAVVRKQNLMQLKKKKGSIHE
jgi:xanthine dehydrogenase accessory factor